MPLSTISIKRPITSYTKIHKFVTKIVKNRKIFIKNKSIKNKNLLNIGCGPETKSNFINLDFYWLPGIDVCWDINKLPYPFDKNRFEGIFTEHCLEHITFIKCFENLKEFYRMLKPGGVLRIIVPDGELYLDLYQKNKVDKNVRLPLSENEPTAIYSVNRIFREHEHKFIYDYETYRLLLEKVGFKNIYKRSFGVGSDQRLLIDKKEHAIESLYVEAMK